MFGKKFMRAADPYYSIIIHGPKSSKHVFMSTHVIYLSEIYDKINHVLRGIKIERSVKKRKSHGKVFKCVIDSY